MLRDLPPVQRYAGSAVRSSLLLHVMQPQAGQVEYIACMHLSQPQKWKRVLEQGELCGRNDQNQKCVTPAKPKPTHARLHLTAHADLFEIRLAGVDCDPRHFAVFGAVGAIAAAIIVMDGSSAGRRRGLREWSHVPHGAASSISCFLPLEEV